YPSERLEPETRILAEKIAKGPRGNGLSKRAIYKALSMDFDSALEYEAYIQHIAGSTKDHKEGVDAFVEKRPPNFTGN
ncbi:MAG: 2-(1,2-epoxy-1,2-dihydrophenyl)acetyl-CoA isomerase, partial [Nitrososphaerota archaeon]|nr:2-(1,2-epoxy-1,2-dihydrophenyl)acetyl-CoA isomerase [Nitrososphaerota archaeon]